MADGFSVDFDGDLARLIDRRAREAGVAREALIRAAVEQSLFRYEDYNWSGDDPRAAVDQPIAPPAPAVAWDEVERWMRSWGKPDELPKPRPR